MDPQQLIESGDLTEAIAAQSAQVKAHPTDLDARYALSVLLCFAGDLDRAFLQLNVMGQQDAELGNPASVYRNLIIAENARRSFYNTDGDPLLPPDCPASFEKRVDAVKALRRGDAGAAADALEAAQSSESPLEAKVNGELASDLRDYDDFIGPALELYAGGNYLWMPISRIRSLEIQKPKTQLDLLWAPAKLIDASGTDATVHVPALYEGSHLADDGRVRVGRMTEWIDAHGVGFRGAGQKVLLVEHGGEPRELGVLEMRTLEPVAASSGEASGG